jgi:ABC-2 type transport system permease protein
MSAMAPTIERHTTRYLGPIQASATAFLAIIRRDLLVTRRQAIPFLLQTLLQPLFYLFVFGKVLSSIGATGGGFSVVLLPGVVAITTFLTAFQATAIDLARDLSFTLEIEDRLLAPIPVTLVAVEKILLAAMRGLLAGALIFPLGYWILGDGYQVRTDRLIILIGLLILVAFVGAAFGVLLGTLAPVQQLPLLFALVLTPLIFTGCVFYPWSALENIKWFQTLTLFNPLTYASEGLRYAMVPPIGGHELPTLDITWILLALGAALIACLIGGVIFFRRRVVS